MLTLSIIKADTGGFVGYSGGPAAAPTVGSHR